MLNNLKTKKDLIIVQELIEKVQISGVIFTNDINSNAPYYLINYDESGKTDLVTSGKKVSRTNNIFNSKIIVQVLINLIN